MIEGHHSESPVGKPTHKLILESKVSFSTTFWLVPGEPEEFCGFRGRKILKVGKLGLGKLDLKLPASKSLLSTPNCAEFKNLLNY
jgi:hypothetical protein